VLYVIALYKSTFTTYLLSSRCEDPVSMRIWSSHVLGVQLGDASNLGSVDDPVKRSCWLEAPDELGHCWVVWRCDQTEQRGGS